MKPIIYLLVLLISIMAVQAVDVANGSTFQPSQSNATYIFTEDVLNFSVIQVGNVCLNATREGFDFSFCTIFSTPTTIFLTAANFTPAPPTNPRLIVTRILPTGNISVEQLQSFTYRVNVTCINDDCDLVEVDLFANVSLISNVPGAIPFDTDITNPFFINLTQDQQAIFTHTITANADPLTVWDILTQAQLVSNSSIFNQSVSTFVTITAIPPVGTFNITFIESGEDFAKFIFMT